ncbi:MAG: hypothetical protein WAV46_01295 [Candidatus Moraniibacteriota bacterium]
MRHEAIDETRAAIAVILSVLEHAVQGTPRVSAEGPAAFVCFRNFCAVRLYPLNFQDDIYGAIGLALLNTKYERKRGNLIRDINAFLRLKRRRVAMVPEFIQVFSQAKKEMALLKRFSRNAAPLNTENLPAAFASLRL